MLKNAPADILTPLALDEAQNFAREQGLRYVADTQPGFLRRRAGKGFCYLDSDNKRIICDKTLTRIRALVIPPAWQEVWICKHANGHLQATGRDARARKQYRYHEEWNRTRNEDKFRNLLRFAKVLPDLRKTVARHLLLPGMPMEKVLAAVVGVLETARLRVGNDFYTRQNKTFGLTTIRNRHAKVKGTQIHFHYRGKSGVIRDVTFSDSRLSRIIRRCQDLPGEELFCYVDDEGVTRDIGSADVNTYLRTLTGESITAKDFRTWGGTIKALELLVELGPLEDDTQRARKSRELAIIRAVAADLGNTVAVCRKYYVSPQVFVADRDGSLHRWAAADASRRRLPYSKNERLLLKILKSYKD